MTVLGPGPLGPHFGYAHLLHFDVIKIHVVLLLIAVWSRSYSSEYFCFR